jgi:hypothetical protein
MWVICISFQGPLLQVMLTHVICFLFTDVNQQSSPNNFTKNYLKTKATENKESVTPRSLKTEMKIVSNQSVIF